MLILFLRAWLKEESVRALMKPSGFKTEKGNVKILTIYTNPKLFFLFYVITDNNSKMLTQTYRSLHHRSVSPSSDANRSVK